MCCCLNRSDKGKTPREWTQYSLAWIDEFCFYRIPGEIDRILALDFEVQHIEEEYAGFRRQYSRLSRMAMHFSGALARINGPISRTLGGLVFLANKKSVARSYPLDARNGNTSSTASTPLGPEIGYLAGRTLP